MAAARNLSRGIDEWDAADLRRDARHRAAFTIVELVVVVLVMSILAAAAVPTFYKSLLHHRAESAARRVKQDLEFLRDSAKARSTTYECEFNGTTYTLDEDATSGIDHAGPYTVNLAEAPYSVPDVSNNFDDGETITFNGYGGASEDAQIVLVLGGESRTIHIASATGQITISNP